MDVFAAGSLGRGFAGFIFQNVLQVGLSAFDFGGQHRFLCRYRRQEDVRIGESVEQSFQSGDGPVGFANHWHEGQQIKVLRRQIVRLKRVHILICFKGALGNWICIK